jgi:hypothetical protein
MKYPAAENMVKADFADRAIANFFYENNIAFNVAESATYKAMVRAIKDAGTLYVGNEVHT